MFEHHGRAVAHLGGSQVLVFRFGEEVRAEGMPQRVMGPFCDDGGPSGIVIGLGDDHEQDASVFPQRHQRQR